MRIVDFLNRYGRVEHLEAFRGEDVPAGVPDRPGIYAWYAQVALGQADLADVNSSETLQKLVSDELIGRFQRQSYTVEARAALEPAFKGNLEHLAPVPNFNSVADGAFQDTARALFGFFSGPFAPFFSSPIYIGKAIKQSLAARVAQHVEALDRYSSKSSEFLAGERQRLLGMSLNTGADNDELGHTFALEAAARQISARRLVLVTYSPPEMDKDVLSVLEHLVNRIAFPLCGRR